MNEDSKRYDTVEELFAAQKANRTPPAALMEGFGLVNGSNKTMSDLLEELNRRSLSVHGGTGRPWIDQGNLTHGDSIMHREAISAINQMRAALTVTRGNIESLAAAQSCTIYHEWARLIDDALALRPWCEKCGLPPGCPACRAVHDVPIDA